ncbi:MAG: hypothetical protein OEV78_07265 [Spirochaetia bacterium]|nr:hypothetical protein [Spirochaetia bacterium]
MNWQKELKMFGGLNAAKSKNFTVKKYNPNQIIRHSIRSYYKNKNWDGLLKYLLLLEERKQLPHSWRWQIGQLYIYNKEVYKGLDYLYSLHFREPLHPDVHLTIFEALRILGKNENSFNWIKRPKINEIETSTLQDCYNIIQQKKTSIALFILYSMIKTKYIYDFDEFDLLFALKKDNRFSVFNDTCFFRFSKIDIIAETLKYIA